jgi:hypothetical protein
VATSRSPYGFDLGEYRETVGGSDEMTMGDRGEVGIVVATGRDSGVVGTDRT